MNQPLGQSLIVFGGITKDVNQPLGQSLIVFGGNAKDVNQPLNKADCCTCEAAGCAASRKTRKLPRNGGSPA